MLDCVPFEMLCLPPAYAQVAAYVGDEGLVDAKGKPVAFTQTDLARAGAQVQIVLSVAPEKPPASFYTKFRSGGSVIYYSRYCEALHCGFELSVVDQAAEAEVERCGVASHVVSVDGVDAEGLRHALGAIHIRVATGASDSWPTLASLPEPPPPDLTGQLDETAKDGKTTPPCAGS